MLNNRRYFNLTDILIFDDSTIKLDVLPKYYFSEIMEKLYEDTYLECDRLITNTSLSEISEAFNADIRKVYSSLRGCL